MKPYIDISLHSLECVKSSKFNGCRQSLIDKEYYTDMRRGKGGSLTSTCSFTLWMRSNVALPCSQLDRSCQNRQFWWRSSSDCRARCSLAWGRSGWCWSPEWRGRVGPCRVAGQTCAWGWATLRGSLCCVATHTGCRKEAQRPDRDDCETWMSVLTELEKWSFTEKWETEGRRQEGETEGGHTIPNSVRSGALTYRTYNIDIKSNTNHTAFYV